MVEVLRRINIAAGERVYAWGGHASGSAHLTKIGAAVTANR